MLWIKAILSSALVVVASSCVVAGSELRLPPLFADYMILQSGAPVPVWGTAAPGAQITVGLAGEVERATADSTGHWQVRIQPPAPGVGYQLQVTADNSAAITFEDVAVGEVWLCSGQSNMVMSLSGAEGGREIAADAAARPIRLFTVPEHSSAQPTQHLDGQWVASNQGDTRRFSAVAAAFGVELNEALDVPVGLINASVGGTTIDTWIPFDGLRGIDDSTRRIADYLSEPESDPWHSEGGAAGLREKYPERAAVPPPLSSPRLFKNIPSNLFNGMIHPLVPYGIRGVIWYQGETDALLQADTYAERKQALVSSWRRLWQSDLPFGWVQLPEFSWNLPLGAMQWPLIRDQQRRALDIPGTGMVATLGLGDPDDIHPRRKVEIGKRLADWALNDVYGMPRRNGPLPVEITTAGERIVIRFAPTGTPDPDFQLVAREGAVSGFEIAAADRQWLAAQAALEGPDTVVIWHPEIANPEAVRYAWADNPQWSLLDDRGLPVPTFRTDDWPLVAPPAQPVGSDLAVRQLPLTKRDEVEIHIDGNFDEAAWQAVEAWPLVDLTTGEAPQAGGKVRMLRAPGSLYLAIECFDPAPETIISATSIDGDRAIWNGDAVEVLIATDAHDYAQFVINPAGAQVSIDRSFGIIDGINRIWEAATETAVLVTDSGWQIEMRIPILSPEQATGFPPNGLSGTGPNVNTPWAVNICRQRPRSDGAETTALSPTGGKGFHHRSSFVNLVGDCKNTCDCGVKD